MELTVWSGIKIQKKIPNRVWGVDYGFAINSNERTSIVSLAGTLSTFTNYLRHFAPENYSTKKISLRNSKKKSINFPVLYFRRKIYLKKKKFKIRETKRKRKENCWEKIQIYYKGMVFWHFIIRDSYTLGLVRKGEWNNKKMRARVEGNLQKGGKKNAR